MPRNGDGSSDNGPIEGQNIVHGNSGDVCSLAAIHHFIYIRITDNLFRHLLSPSTLRTTLHLLPSSRRAQVRFFYQTFGNKVYANEFAAIEGLNASGGGNKADQAEPTVAGDAPKKQ